ncbi:MAG: hypothetical protein ACTSPS_10755, partial [Promethearchaeota archaeon]
AFTIILNALPLVILFIPCIFLHKKLIGKLYMRIFAGIVVFYLIYWILPIIFQINAQPNKLTVDEGDPDNIALGIRYIAAHMGSLIALFAFYPLVTLPFIFFVVLFISFIFLWIHLRKEDGTIKENLKHLTYEFEESPYDKIINGLLKGDWTREKQILKLMIVLLPISLYLLQTILDISGLQNISLTTGETALGWFIEILFVYLAVFIFSIELLFSSQVALKGRYWGEKLRKQTYRSLYSVGAPISILSLILFVIQYTTSIFIIIYFFAYFIMVSVIFVLFLKVFEPISILIFIKLIDWWKNRKERIKSYNSSKWYFIVESAKFEYENPSLQNSLRFDLLNMFSFVVLVVFPMLIMSLLLVYSLRYIKSFFIGVMTFLPIVIVFSIIMISIGANPLISFRPEEYWLTGQLSYTTVFGFRFYTFRTAAFDANLFPQGKLTLLGILAIPYLYTRYIFNVIIWSLMILYYKKDYKVKNIPIDEKCVERKIFASEKHFLSVDDYNQGTIQYLITKNKKVTIDTPEQDREDVKNVLQALENDKLLKDIKPEDSEQMKKFYYTLKYLFSTNQICIWSPEFSYIFEKVEKQGLYIIYTDGRGVYDYPFKKEVLQDPGLISGMFTAISSFIKETTKSTQLLKTIDHGDISILIEYGEFVFAALFVKGSSAEVRSQLKSFVKRFEAKHVGVLPDLLLKDLRQNM